MLKNAVTIFGVVISLGTILVITYVPFLQVGGDTLAVSFKIWECPRFHLGRCLRIELQLGCSWWGRVQSWCLHSW